ncbi:High affinity nitrate transporter 2.5 [Bienertia sinuspersici]
MVYLFFRPIGGGLSDFSARKFGMRGRLWSWWIVQGLSGVLCIILGRLNISASIVVMIVFSMFVQATQGLTFGVVPFVQKWFLGDWSWCKCGCCHNSSNFLPRISIQNGKWNYIHGYYDHSMQLWYSFHILPTMGRYDLWSLSKLYRRRVLLEGMGLKGTGIRTSSSKHEIC